MTVVDGQFTLIAQEIPTPGPKQVLIKTAYSTVNPHDRGTYKTRKDAGFVIGCEGTGTITGVGEGVS